MSATNRSAVRIEQDNYPTPSWVVRRLLEAVQFPGGNWLEPAAGDGNIIRAVNAVRTDVRWHAIEKRQLAANGLMMSEAEDKIWKVHADDFLEPETEDFFPTKDEEPVVCLTNPPFSLAMGYVERCLEVAPHVALLLRVNFLGSDKRANFWRRCPPDLYILPNRPSFTGGGTDATEYAWFVWGPTRIRERGHLTVLPVTSKEERKPVPAAPQAKRRPVRTPFPGVVHAVVGDEND